MLRFLVDFVIGFHSSNVLIVEVLTDHFGVFVLDYFAVFIIFGRRSVHSLIDIILSLFYYTFLVFQRERVHLIDFALVILNLLALFD